MLIQLFITPQVQTVDAPGRTVKEALHTMGYTDVKSVAIGRYLEFEMNGYSLAEIPAKLEQICSDGKVNLVNPVMEDWQAHIVEPSGQITHIKGKKRQKR